MDSYKDLNKQEILRRWYAYVDLLEREWTMTADGEIIKVPNNEIAKSYCELLIELHREVAPYRDELMRDFEANPNDEFLQKCVNGIFKEYSDEETRRLIDAFHLEGSETVKPAITDPIERLKKENSDLWKDGVWLFGGEGKMVNYLNSLKGGTTPLDAAEKYLNLSNVNNLRERNTKKTLYNLLYETGIIRCKYNNFSKQLKNAY